MEKLFKIVECGTDNVVLGLENIPANHAQLIMITRANTPISLLNVGEKTTCDFVTGMGKNTFDVVRVQ